MLINVKLKNIVFVLKYLSVPGGGGKNQQYSVNTAFLHHTGFIFSAAGRRRSFVLIRLSLGWICKDSKVLLYRKSVNSSVTAGTDAGGSTASRTLASTLG